MFSATSSKFFPKLTNEGKKVLQVLITTYGMTQENAKRFMRDGGLQFAMVAPGSSRTLELENKISRLEQDNRRLEQDNKRMGQLLLSIRGSK
jgi:hypothetical protein